MIFPALKNKVFGYVNLNIEAQWWIDSHSELRPGTLVDPKISSRMVEDVHKKYRLDFSYGGWMEDRRFLWKGTYLEPLNTYIHLGIDINVPEGTEIATNFDAEVVKVDDDYPEEGGWGPRVILKHSKEPVYILYAHLGRNVKCKEGDLLKTGSVFATVGSHPYNGNWFPHVHVQVIRDDYYSEIKKENKFDEVDGYGSEENLKINSYRFPDPLRYISLS